MSRTRKPEEPDSDTRKRLLDAARDLFTSRGFEATSTRDIAAQAGCNLSLIKYYFGSKEGLLREVLRPYITGVGDRIQDVVLQDLSAEQLVDAVIAAVLGQVSQNAALFRLVFREVCSEGSPMSVELRDMVLRNQRIILSLFTRGREDGILKDLPPQVMAMMVAGMLMFYFVGYPLTSMLVGPMSPEVLETIRRTATEIALHGILQPPGTQGTPGQGKEDGA